MSSLRTRLHHWRARRHPAELVAPQAPPPVVERGAFAYGRCRFCDWEGPGRRARSGAVSDAQLHTLVGCQADPHEVPSVIDRPHHHA